MLFKRKPKPLTDGELYALRYPPKTTPDFLTEKYKQKLREREERKKRSE